MFYPSPRGRRARAADRTSGHLQNMCFTVFRLLGHQKRRVFVCLGRNGSDGQACHVPGASWPSKSYQRLTKGMLWRSLFAIFPKKRYPEREGSQVVFSLLASKPKTDQLCDRNLDVQDLPESSVYTVLPVNRTIPTTAVWA